MESLEQQIGYVFSDRSLLETALTHSSYANEKRLKGLSSNERLEFLGDSVLGMVAASHLYRRFPDMPEGRMTRLRAELVCEQSLHAIALELGLGGHMKLGKGEERTGGRQRPSILADAVEAVIAAIYLDGGMERAEKFIISRVLSGLQEDSDELKTDFKTRLQEVVQSREGEFLAYEPAGESGPDHMKTFAVRVTLNGNPIGEGMGHTKKEAEQAAARAALEKMES